MIIRCTKKLLTELKEKPLTEESEEDPFWSWHANVFRIERRKCVLVTNDSTLFTMFIPSLRKNDFQNFKMVFGQRLFKTLLNENIPQDLIEKALAQSEDIKYYKTNSRSVLGSMNDQKFQIEHYVHSDGGLEYTEIYDVNHNLNRVIMGAIGYNYPVEMFKKRLEEIT